MSQLALPITDPRVGKVCRTTEGIVYLQFAYITPVGIHSDAKGVPTMAMVTGHTEEGVKQDFALTRNTVAQFHSSIVRGRFFPSGDAAPRNGLEEGPADQALDATICSLRSFTFLAAVRPRTAGIKVPGGQLIPLCEAVHAFPNYNRRQASDPAGSGFMLQTARGVGDQEPAEIRLRIQPKNGAIVVYHYPITVRDEAVIDLIKSLDKVSEFQVGGAMAAEGKLSKYSVRRRLTDIDWAIVQSDSGFVPSTATPVPGVGDTMRDLSQLPE